ncbi:hypothetical protein B296_00009294 [Ensete ventricosum]|uniref:DUF834 domain-containing protein n=1 Tax=Ensete ventricosum TaxID=4639 RepID=A0A426ZR65_ENSVE|nr:hypothetical protein B296_00009294 [Ensete ventricosum]
MRSNLLWALAVAVIVEEEGNDDKQEVEEAEGEDSDWGRRGLWLRLRQLQLGAMGSRWALKRREGTEVAGECNGSLGRLVALKWLRRGVLGFDKQWGPTRKRKQRSSGRGRCDSKDGRGGWAALEGVEMATLDLQVGRISKAEGPIKAAASRGGRMRAAAVVASWRWRQVMGVRGRRGDGGSGLRGSRVRGGGLLAVAGGVVDAVSSGDSAMAEGWRGRRQWRQREECPTLVAAKSKGGSD